MARTAIEIILSVTDFAFHKPMKWLLWLSRLFLVLATGFLAALVPRIHALIVESSIRGLFFVSGIASVIITAGTASGVITAAIAGIVIAGAMARIIITIASRVITAAIALYVPLAILPMAFLGITRFKGTTPLFHSRLIIP